MRGGASVFLASPPPHPPLRGTGFAGFDKPPVVTIWDQPQGAGSEQPAAPPRSAAVYTLPPRGGSAHSHGAAASLAAAGQRAAAAEPAAPPPYEDFEAVSRYGSRAEVLPSAPAPAPPHSSRYRPLNPTGYGAAAAAAAPTAALSSSTLTSSGALHPHARPGSVSSTASSGGSRASSAGRGPSSSATPSGGPGCTIAGLANLGNTCYMNSTLQCLAHIVPLAAFFSSERWEAGLVPASARRSDLVTRLARSFARLLRDLSEASRGGGGVRCVTPTELRRLAGSALSEEGMFSGSAQNDAHELLRFFLDALGEALNRVRERAVYRELKEERVGDEVLAARYWRSYAEREDSIVGDIFRGQLRSVMTCGKCGYKSRSFEPFEELLLQIGKGAQVGGLMAAGVYGSHLGGASSSSSGSVRIEHLLQAFVQPETLSGEEAWRCESCKHLGVSTKQISVYKAPRVLILVLKRFSYTRVRRCKVDTPVCIAPQDPLEGLQLGPFMCDSAQGREEAAYDLVGCVNHSGGTHGGHYTADCRVGGRGGGWYNFNDSHASSIGDVGRSSAARREPYVLFYEKRQ
jgi:ubiquitin C-terminal hydrolase